MGAFIMTFLYGLMAVGIQVSSASSQEVTFSDKAPLLVADYPVNSSWMESGDSDESSEPRRHSSGNFTAFYQSVPFEVSCKERKFSQLTETRYSRKIFLFNCVWRC